MDVLRSINNKRYCSGWVLIRYSVESSAVFVYRPPHFAYEQRPSNIIILIYVHWLSFSNFMLLHTRIWPIMLRRFLFLSNAFVAPHLRKPRKYFVSCQGVHSLRQWSLPSTSWSWGISQRKNQWHVHYHRTTFLTQYQLIHPQHPKRTPPPWHDLRDITSMDLINRLLTTSPRTYWSPLDDGEIRIEGGRATNLPDQLKWCEAVDRRKITKTMLPFP